MRLVLALHPPEILLTSFDFAPRLWTFQLNNGLLFDSTMPLVGIGYAGAKSNQLSSVRIAEPWILLAIKEKFE